MAEVARLGLEIDAKGVSETRAELLRLAQSAAEAARNFEGVGDSVARSGEKIAGAPDGFASFEVSAKKADPTIKQFAKSAASGTVALLELGPAGNAAANALQAVITGAGPAAVAMAAIGGAILFVNSQIDKQREKLRDLAEREYQQLQRANDNLKLDQGVRQQIKVLEALDPELETIRQKYEQLAIAAEKSGASQDELSRLARLGTLEQNKLATGRLDAIAKEQQAIQQQIAAAQFERAALGQTGLALIDLTTQQKIHAIQTSELAAKHGALAQQLVAHAVALGNLQKAQQLINTGGNATTEFQNQFGVTFDIEKKRVGEQLASQFAVVFNTVKNDRGAQAQLAQAFESLVTQAVGIGVPNIGELIASKIGDGEFLRLRQGLGDDLRGQLDATEKSFRAWGQTFDNEVRGYLANAAEVGARTDDIVQKWNRLQNEFTAGLAAKLDVSQPLAAVEQMRAGIASIPDVTYKSVVLQTYYAASPARPFSEFLPFMAKTFGSLQDMVANATPEVILNVPDIAQRLRQIADLERASAEAFHSANFPRGVGQVDSSGVRRQNQDAGLSLLQQSQDLALLLQADIARAQLAAERRGGGAAASGGDTFIFDAKGATFNSMTLDDALLQFERTIINATGVDPRIRVTS